STPAARLRSTPPPFRGSRPGPRAPWRRGTPPGATRPGRRRPGRGRRGTDGTPGVYRARSSCRSRLIVGPLRADEEPPPVRVRKFAVAIEVARGDLEPEGLVDHVGPHPLPRPRVERQAVPARPQRQLGEAAHRPADAAV